MCCCRININKIHSYVHVCSVPLSVATLLCLDTLFVVHHLISYCRTNSLTQPATNLQQLGSTGAHPVHHSLRPSYLRGSVPLKDPGEEGLPERPTYRVPTGPMACVARLVAANRTPTFGRFSSEISEMRDVPPVRLRDLRNGVAVARRYPC